VVNCGDFVGAKNSIKDFYFIDDATKVIGRTITKTACTKCPSDIHRSVTIENSIHIDGSAEHRSRRIHAIDIDLHVLSLWIEGPRNVGKDARGDWAGSLDTMESVRVRLAVINTELDGATSSQA